MDITALIAGVFGGFIGNMLVNYFTKNLDFKYDYKKYILQKRQAAYDEVEKILMDLETDDTDESDKSIPAVFSTDTTLWNFQDKIATTIISYRVWLSEEVLTILYAIQELNDRVRKDFQNSKRYHGSIGDFRDPLYKAFFHDIRKLDNITEFKNTKLNK